MGSNTRTRLTTACAAVAVLASGLGRGGSAWADNALSATSATGTQALSVTFNVTNTNTSALPCSSDGRPYQVHGTLVGPSSDLTGAGAGPVTVYLHGFNIAGWMWHFQFVDGYDYATTMARSGH